MDKFNFGNLIGNSNTLVLLERMLSSGTFSKFSIFEGTLGTGKSTSARIAALRLTCENPQGGNPCCQCRACRENIRAFKTTGESTSVKVVNLGTFENKSDVTDLIKNVFVLRAGDTARVYVLEEAHVLKRLAGAQTAFLEEIDHMPPNTYIIMCTTRAYDVIPELASRAITFPFRKLSAPESRSLATQEAGGAVPDDVLSLVVKSSGGIPRKIINSIEFIRENGVSLDEYREFISDVSDDFITQMVVSMLSEDIATFLSLCDVLQEKRQSGTVLRALKDYFVRALFVVEGDVRVDVSRDNSAVIKDLLVSDRIVKTINLLNRYNMDLTESDLVFALYSIRLILQSRTIQDVYRESKQQASQAKEEAFIEVANKENLVEKKSVLTPLDLKAVNSFSR